MRIELHHCLIFILFLAIAQVVVAGSPSARSKINISSIGDEDNCTRDGDVLICPCDVMINGTYYPCWLPITNATTPNNTICTVCSQGYFSNNQTGNCTMDDLCPEGTCLEPYSCELCPIGTYSNETGTIECALCPAGSVSRELGSYNCTSCPPGFSTNGREGASACIGCTAGYFSNESGTPYCNLCDFGYYSQDKSESCTKCPRGTYNDKRGQSISGCNGCGLGYYGNAPGLTSHSQCSLCPVGYYCPDSVTVSPVECPRGAYCALGAKDPIKCAALYDSEVGMASCKPSVGFFIVVFGSIGVVISGLVIVWRWRRVKRQRLQREYQQTEIDKLIPKPRDGGPVYTGF